MTLPGLSFSTMSARISLGAGFPGIKRGGDDDIDLFRLLAEQGHLGVDELLAHGLGIAAGARSLLP